MNYEEFPTENGTVPETARRKISPMSFMAHKLRELKRPSRLRSRIFFSLIFISSVILIVLGKWHAVSMVQAETYLQFLIFMHVVLEVQPANIFL